MPIRIGGPGSPSTAPGSGSSRASGPAREADADDVVQEAFVRFWKHQRHLPGDPNALVVTSIRRAALDLLRRTDRRGVREKAVAADDMETVAWFEPEADPRLQALAQSLQPLLPAEQREVVVLKVWGDAHLRTDRRTIAAFPEHRGLAVALCHGGPA